MSNLSHNRNAEIEELFDVFDSDNDGYINTNDLRRFMNSLNEYPSDKEIQDMIVAIDSTGEGRINLVDFTKVISQDTLNKFSHYILLNEFEIQEAFRIFDKNNKGYLTKDDLYIIMNSFTELSRLEVDCMIEETMKNSVSDKLLYEDFVRLLKSLD